MYHNAPWISIYAENVRKKDKKEEDKVERIAGKLAKHQALFRRNMNMRMGGKNCTTEEEIRLKRKKTPLEKWQRGHGAGESITKTTTTTTVS